MTFAAIGSAIWGGLKKLPDWVWWLVLVIATGFAIDLRARWDEQAKMKAKQRERDLNEMGRVNDARQKATEENINAAERADEAVRDMPRYLPDELREQEPDVAAIVLGPSAR